MEHEDSASSLPVCLPVSGVPDLRIRGVGRASPRERGALHAEGWRGDHPAGERAPSGFCSFSAPIVFRPDPAPAALARPASSCTTSRTRARDECPSAPSSRRRSRAWCGLSAAPSPSQASSACACLRLAPGSLMRRAAPGHLRDCRLCRRGRASRFQPSGSQSARWDIDLPCRWPPRALNPPLGSFPAGVAPCYSSHDGVCNQSISPAGCDPLLLIQLRLSLDSYLHMQHTPAVLALRAHHPRPSPRALPVEHGHHRRAWRRGARRRQIQNPSPHFRVQLTQRQREIKPSHTRSQKLSQLRISH